MYLTAKLLARFGRSTSGVAVVEFALILPLMLLLLIGSVELGDLISVNKRIHTVSGSMGDLVARSNKQISPAELNDYFVAAGTTMAPYSSANLAQIVTSVFVDEDGATTVSWSRGFNGATAHTAGAAYNLPAELIAIAKSKHVIVSEASLAYQPLFGYVFKNTFNLSRESYYLPRFGGIINVV